MARTRKEATATFSFDELELILKCVAHHGTEYAHYDYVDELRSKVNFLLREEFPRVGIQKYLTHEAQEGA
jgi:hypothetical protein